MCPFPGWNSIATHNVYCCSPLYITTPHTVHHYTTHCTSLHHTLYITTPHTVHHYITHCTSKHHTLQTLRIPSPHATKHYTTNCTPLNSTQWTTHCTSLYHTLHHYTTHYKSRHPNLYQTLQTIASCTIHSLQKKVVQCLQRTVCSVYLADFFSV